MKSKISFLISILLFLSVLYTGFSPNDDDPQWNNSPRTVINLSPSGQYVELPQGDNFNYSNEPRYISTPQGTFAVGPNFRVHPRSAGTQSEVPITRHPLNPNVMFASANTFQGGNFCTGVYATSDGGVTWYGNDTLMTSGGTPVFNFGDPAPMIDHTGRFLISYITLTGSMGASYSTNAGVNWSNTVTFPSATTSADKNLSATDGEPTSAFYGRSYTVYTEFAGPNTNRIVSSFTTNGGVSWSAVIPVSPPPSPGHHHQGCDVTVDVYGWVRVVWANCTTNGQNSTEDSLGWAESPNGGVSWSDVSNSKVNMNGIRSADFLTPSTAIIRVNGFPRIATDRTCNPSRDDFYVVTAEKNFAPALDNGDIVLMKSPDGGSSWTRVRVNQNPSGSYEWCPAVNVDETGAINVCYYSTRNVPTSDSAEIYLSRSTNGGLSFTDVKVSDHKFRPAPIAGTAGGYQGDYIGITSGGAGKILPYWCEGSSASGGRYQAWTALVDVTQSQFCEDFSCTALGGIPTSNIYEEFSGTNYWSRLNPTAYGQGGTGSARFNSWSAPIGTIQSLVSYEFTAAGANTYVTFDEAYAPWNGGTTNIDSLIIETSANGGTSWSAIAKLWGGLGANAGPLNTAPPGSQFVPVSSQWAPKIYSLPVGTNKVRLRARSGFGNDIWVDNICVGTVPAAAGNSIGIAAEGMWTGVNPYWRLLDTVRVYLHRIDFPNVAVDSAVGVVGSNSVVSNLFFNRALTGNYYKVIKHRNTIETWSKAGGELYSRGSNTHYNFLTPAGQAYDNNQKLVDPFPYYAMFSGDVNKDHSINLADKLIIYNDFLIFVTGYVPSDLTGDNVTNLSDLIICHNNDQNFVTRHAPPGAEPIPGMIQIADLNNMIFENDEQRQKYEVTRKILEEQIIKNQQDKIKSEQDSKTNAEIKIIGKRKQQLWNEYFETHSPPSIKRDIPAGELR